MAAPETSPALILSLVDNNGAHDQGAPATITLEGNIGNAIPGRRHIDWSDKEGRDMYGLAEIAKQSTGYLPPPGTIFQLIPKPTMIRALSTGSPQLGNNSGFWEVDEAESSADRSSSSTPTQLSQYIHGTEDSSRTILTKAINHLTKTHQGFLSSRTGSEPLTLRMLCLLAPNVGIAEVLYPDTEEVYTTASILPNASSQVFPLSCIVKSHPQHPRLSPMDSYLGEYQAYQAMSDARVQRNQDPSTSTFPAGLPAFFGAWDYSPRSTGTALFPILLLENLRAFPLHGMTLEEWVDTRHPPPAEKLDMLNEMMESVETTLKWVQEKCDTVHRDLPGGNGGNLVVLSGGQEKIPVVVVVDWGLAATGEVFPGERLEDAQSEDQAGGRSVGPDGEIIRSKKTVPAVKGWGRSDITLMKAVFGDVRTWLEEIVEDEGPVGEEEEEELEEEEEEGAPTPASSL